MSGNFGFVPPSDDGSNNSENEDGNPEDNPHFAEIFKQFSGMGLDIKSLIASLSGSGTAANLSRDVIRDISRKTLSAHGELPVGLTDLNQWCVWSWFDNTIVAIIFLNDFENIYCFTSSKGIKIICYTLL